MNNKGFNFKNGFDDASIEVDDVRLINKLLKNTNSNDNNKILELEKNFAE